MFVARMRAEANQEMFEFDDIGMLWLPDLDGEDPIVADVDGRPISAGDFVRAALVMMWSMLLETAQLQDLDPGALVTQLGLSLAQYEPPEGT
jgi:hypothetical protein